MKPAESTAPEEFGPYVVYERLGVGGMATVHRAKKRGIAGFERGVALKRMLPHLAEDVEFINSFVREAKLASLLVHPNIAQIYDFGRVGSIYYIAMEHVDGFDVRKMLRYSNRHKEPLPLNVVISILCELCDALEYAHTFVDEHGTPQGIVHRDVSPSNLIVAQSGHLKVIDFGIAKANVRQLHTESGRVKGKLGYMSPEAVSGRAFGPVSDVFSAGVVAHELLTAHPLFSAKTDYDTLIRIHEAEIPPPSRRNPGVPASLDEVVLTALARDPERRLQTAGAFREALEYVAEQAGIRFSARDVAEWRAKIATTEDPWGSRTSLPNVTSNSMSRAFPFTDSRNPMGVGTGPRVRPADTAQRQAASGDIGRATTALGEPDEDKAVADMTWGSDAPASAHHHPLPDQALQPLAVAPQTATHTTGSLGGAAAAPGAMIGAGIVQPRRNSFARIALIVLSTIAAGLAVYQFVLRPKKPAPPPPPAVVTAIKFIVQPADAIIEIGGKEASRTSPFEAPVEPGIYSIAVHRPGFKRYTSDVKVAAGETQTVRVALEAGTAQIALTSTPPGMVVLLDGKPLDQVTPVEFQTSAGPHQLVVNNPNGAPWIQDFTAQVDGKHSFNATLATTKRPAGTQTPVVTPTPPPRTTTADRNDRDRNDRNRRTPAIVRPGDRMEETRQPDPAPTQMEPAPTPPVVAARPDAGVPPAVMEPARPPTTTTPPAAVTNKAPPVVAATTLTKLQGDIPQLRVNSNDNFADVTAKLCLDDRGRVSSVKMIKVLAEISEELQRALMAWRYKPYVNNAGQVSPACFVASFRVVFKRA